MRDLGARSFWLDEVASVVFSKHSASELVTIIGRDRDKVGVPNMATYYLGLHFWLKLGETEALVRVPSVIAGAASVIPVYLTARRMGGMLAGGAAAFVFALHPFVIRYSQEARGYSLAMLVVATLTLLLLVAVERRAQWGWWLAYGVVAALGLYVHFFVALTLAAHGGWVLASRNLPPWRSILVGAAPLAIALIPIPFIVQRYGGGYGWIGSITPLGMWNALSDLGGGALLALLSLAIIGVAAWLWRRDARMWLVLATFAVPILLTVGVSFVKPLLLARYLVISLPPLAVLIGLAVGRLRPWPTQAAVAAVLAATLVLALPSAYTDIHGQDWRSLGAWMAPQVERDDRILMRGWGRRSVDYYLQRAGQRRLPYGISRRAALAREPRSRIWVITKVGPRLAEDTTVSLLSDRYEITEVRTFGTKVVAFLLTPRIPVTTTAFWYDPAASMPPAERDGARTDL
jgi:mannosyltransferase